MTPDKIYVKRNIFGEMTGYEEDWCHPPHCVEYVRKDTFINKACEWIEENITNNPNANSVLVRNGCVTLGMLIEDFKNFMRGE